MEPADPGPSSELSGDQILPPREEASVSARAAGSTQSERPLEVGAHGQPSSPQQLSSPQQPSQQPLPPADPDAPSMGPGLSALLGFGVAALACFGLGWLGYQLVTRLGPQPAGPLPEEALTTAPSGGAGSATVPAPSLPPPDGSSGAGPGVLQGSALASVPCLAGGIQERQAPADPSNYGPRQAADWQGRPVPSSPALIVLHETVVDEATTLNLFRRRHDNDGHQASYHVLIGRDGERIRVVDDSQRAFGAGDSQFEGLAQQLKPGLAPSINNIALHVSLVSPPDGADGEARAHRGYTAAQYRSLATQIALWQARYGIPGSRVVTHQEVDRSGSRRDPRSFDWSALGRDLVSQWTSCGGSGQLADLGR